MVKRRLIAFDLDGTLAVTKSAISHVMATGLRDLLDLYDVCVISGGKFDQFKKQVIDRLEVTPHQMSRLHIMPTSGTRYMRFDPDKGMWVTQYAEDLPTETKSEIVEVLTNCAKELGYWEAEPYGDIIEDRGSQITYSALGQEAPAAKKYAWDPDGAKKGAVRDCAAKLLPDLEVHVGGTTSVDVTQKGIDKAYGMRKLMSVMGLTADEILFFGDKLEDGGNDYPVKTVGIDCIAVEGWEQTAVAVESIVQVCLDV
ncbi:MAG: HAD-IIB family hydrolase [Acidimicrobiia bacterium]